MVTRLQSGCANICHRNFPLDFRGIFLYQSMANYYNQFSFIIDVDTQEEVDFFTKSIADAEDEEINEDAQHVCEFIIEIQDDGKFRLWFCEEENGDIDTLGGIIAAYQQQFKCDEIVSFEWSSTCSRPRLDAFGGGAMVIHKGQVYWHNTYNWICAKTKELNDDNNQNWS